MCLGLGLGFFSFFFFFYFFSFLFSRLFSFLFTHSSFLPSSFFFLPCDPKHAVINRTRHFRSSQPPTPFSQWGFCLIRSWYAEFWMDQSRASLTKPPLVVLESSYRQVSLRRTDIKQRATGHPTPY
ncbi:hypothetical protein LY76DRAFT_271444 [Colletotrichum caudatum]|nr:hypothetical protein LY76DRAFT_271444 [Colletotrichum caudatum]